MGKSKRFAYEYEEYDEGDKSVSTMVEDIISDAEFAELDEVIIGCWGEAWEDSAQEIIDGIVANKEKFSHIKSLFIGDMDYEDCEVSWIIQGDYSKLWEAMPQLESLTIKGSTDLVLGEINHSNLKSLEIICGGLPKNVIESVENAKLPNLEKLLLYIGIEDYGFDGNIDTIKNLLTNSDFPKLTYLGITDSEIQDEIAEAVLASKYMKQITALDLSMGTLTDKGGEMIYTQLPNFPNVNWLHLEYHFMSDEMADKLYDMDGIDVDVSEGQEADEYNGELYYYPMLTE